MNSPTSPNAVSGLASPSRSDAVLLRCRDTIERLQNELEDERFHRRELQQQLHALNDEMQNLRTQLETEQNSRSTAETLNGRLERHVTELEAKVQTQRESLDAMSESAQKAKAETVHKAQELFARGLRVTELEGSVQRAEARAAAARSEADRFTQELSSVSDRLATSESEVSRLRASAEAEAVRVERLTRQCEERERRCEAIQQELDEVRNSAQTVDDTHRVQLMEIHARQDQLVSQVRERERSIIERANEAERASSTLSTEVAGLQQRLAQAEGAATQHEQRTHQLEVDLQTAGKECAKVQAELEVSRQQARHFADEHKEAQDKCLRALAELTQLRRRVEESQRRVDDHETWRTSSAANAELKVQAELELRRVEVEMRRVETELQETKAQLKELRHEDGGAEQQLMQDLSTARAEVGDLKWRLEAAEASRAAARADQEKAHTAALQVQHAEEKLNTKEAEINNLSELLAESQRQLAESQRQLDEVQRHAVESLAYAEEACRNAEAREDRCQAKLREVEWQLDQTTTKVCAEASEASAAAIARVHDAEAMADAVSKSMEGKVERLRHRYEHKMSKMYRHLSEREAYEHKLKSLLQNEVDVLHQYNQEMDDRRWWRSERYDLEDALTDRMRGMMEKAERRITRKLRPP